MKPESRDEVRQWILGALKQDAVVNKNGTVSIDVNTWNNLNLYLQTDIPPASPKLEPQNSLDLEILGKAIHNLRLCKASEVFHDIAHNDHRIPAENEAVYDIDWAILLKKEYDRLMQPIYKEKVLYGGNP